MGSIFCKCFRDKKCKYCGISESYFTSIEHISRPSCRESPNKHFIDNHNYSHSYPGLNNRPRKTGNGYHKFV
mgnify:CR=1 FL=1